MFKNIQNVQNIFKLKNSTFLKTIVNDVLQKKMFTFNQKIINTEKNKFQYIPIQRKFCTQLKEKLNKTKEEVQTTQPNKDQKLLIPFYCNIFTLSELLKTDIIELIQTYKDIIHQDVNDAMEYLNKDDIELFLLEKGYNFEFEKFESKPMKRPMIVTIMGHVDHGKTTLLDTLRNSKLVDQEFGKITQSIGAFNLILPDGTEATFIDTPGHEAFTRLRQRGAKATDLIILVISAIEGVQKQTQEVLGIIKSSQIPYIVALNKCDRDQADPERVIRELKEQGILVNKLPGGNIPVVEISAKTRLNIDKLIQELHSQSKKLHLIDETNIPAQAFVIESKTTKSQSYINPCASVIIRKGIIKEGDVFICGEDSYGKVRQMTNEGGQIVKQGEPGRAVEITGFKTTPHAGTILTIMDNLKIVEKMIESRKKLKEYIEAKNKKELFGKGIKLGKMKNRRERSRLYWQQDREFLKQKFEAAVSNMQISGKKMDEKLLREVYLLEGVTKNKIVLRVDTDGMLESIEDELLREFDSEKIDDVIIDASVLPLTEDDFKFAKNSNSVIFTFNIEQDLDGLAEMYKIGVRKHKLIYDIVEEIKYFIQEADLVDPDAKDNPLIKGRGVVKDVFKIKVNNKPAQIAGVEVESGSLSSSAKFRIIRGKEVLKLGLKVNSLKQNKVNAYVVREGEECGLILDGFDEFQQGDRVECYDTNSKYENITHSKGSINCY
jgi:translation initiation factor IF-2